MSIGKNSVLFFSLFSIFFGRAWGQHNTPATDAELQSQLNEIVVHERSSSTRRQLKKVEINPIESLSKSVIQEKNATTFAQAIDNEKGVDSQTSCAFCGAKRISINGLKGEHTTILIDGIPLHSTVSGFYGVEAIPLDGIESIDIYRGAGASLTAPESIGGSINIMTVDPFVPVKRSTLMYGHDRSSSFNFGASTKVTENAAVFIGGQISNNSNFDIDKNGVTESPQQKNINGFLKSTYRPTEKDEITLNLTYSKLNSYGGNPNDLTLNQPVSLTAKATDFENYDVRKKYIGDPQKITDNISLLRKEASFSYLRQIDENSNLKLSIARAEQSQDAIYSHGYDYNNKDTINYMNTEYRFATDKHLFRIGLDSKNQKMNSASKILYEQMGLKKDNLAHNMSGIYFQDTWFINDSNEISWALRGDHIKVDWSDLNKSIETTLLAPRLYYKYLHNSIWTSRIGLGLGYRSPLTLFESQHGTDHNGFLIDITKIEIAESFVYSLAAQRQSDTFEFSAHFTNLKNMAYGIDRANQSLPTLFTNSKEDYLISVFDINYGRKLTDSYQLEGTVELFIYPSQYKNKLPVAAQEKKFSMRSTYEAQNWSFVQKLNLIFEQDLSSYKYGDHYNIAYTDEDIMSPTYGETYYKDQKRQSSPTYFTLDLLYKRSLSKNWDFDFQITNVFDYTQTGAGDSPLTWVKHGNHFHLDNFHIWGPLQGRKFIISLTGEF
jgi:outer membrane receptor for ferrienterochelin and colicins